MLGLLNIKGVVYGTVLGILAIFVGYGAYEWHFHPLAELRKNNVDLHMQLNEVGRQLNICEANLSKQALQGYIDGVGESNETIVIDFHNLTY